MITYNELASMVQDYGCNVQGMDTPGELLKRYAGDLGAMTYVAFLTRVLGLRKDSLRDPGDGSVAVLLVMPCVASYAVGNRRVAIDDRYTHMHHR